MNSMWRPVVGYEGRYEVSVLGEARSMEREVNIRSGAKRPVPQRHLKQIGHSGGLYLMVCLHKDNDRGNNKTVHRLVLEAFDGPCPDGMESLHADGDGKNNRIENLRWGTHTENMAQRWAGGKR